MRGSANLQISTHLTESEIESTGFGLWTGPSSPPFLHPGRPKLDDASPVASSPSTPSEFEFGSIASFEIRDEPPVSPKLLIAADFWTAAASDHEKQAIALLPHPSTASNQPPSLSVRRLIAEELHGTSTEQEEDDDSPLDFCSAPQTPMRTPHRDKHTESKEWPFSPDERSLRNTLRHESSLLDRRNKPTVLEDEQMLQSSRSEPNSQFALWASSMAWDHQKGEEEKGGLKKQGSRSCMRWAFKDLLRRTVPSSKAEASYITKAMGSSSAKQSLSSSSSSSSPAHLSASARALRPPPSPTHTAAGGRHPTQGGRPSTTQRHSSAAAGRTPPYNPTAPSPPRSPLSAHAARYQQSKAQSLELTRKTFLPYKQSLLGCLGGGGNGGGSSAAFYPEGAKSMAR